MDAAGVAARRRLRRLHPAAPAARHGLAAGPHAPPGRVFVASDAMAVGALQALRKAGRRVPEDVAMVGFDDAPDGRLHTPR